MLKFFQSILAAVLWTVPALADSTINPALPADGLPYSAPIVRGQFDAARNDINALQSLNIGATQPFACTAENAGRMWVDNSTDSLWKLNYCDGSGGTWVPGGYIDTLNHLFTPPTGRGTCQSIVAATTTDLGSVSQSCINVTGNSSVNITSLGTTAGAGDIKVVTFSGGNTLVYNATSLVLPSAINATTSAGDSWIFQSRGAGNWVALSRSSLVAMPAVSPPGVGTNIVAFLNAAGAALTVTADGFVVCTVLSGGACYELGAYSQTFNSAVVGAGGMDIGALPSSGYVCLYAIYNPVTAERSIVGVECATSGTTIYNGTHLPSGYTASALIGTWPTDGTPNLQPGAFTGRVFNYQVAKVVLSTNTAQNVPVALSVASALPPNATAIEAFLIVVIANGSQPTVNEAAIALYPTGVAGAVGYGATFRLEASTGYFLSSSGGHLALTSPQTIYYRTVGVSANVTSVLYINSYSW